MFLHSLIDGCGHSAEIVYFIPVWTLVACMQETNRSQVRRIDESVCKSTCANRSTSRSGNHAYLAEFTNMQCITVHRCTSKSCESGSSSYVMHA